MSYIVSWSGGKDSCQACHRAISQGYELSHLVNFVSSEYNRVSFHGTEAKLIQMQAQSMGIPLVQKATTWPEYEEQFKETVRAIIPHGVEGMVFGDIYLDEHLGWVQGVCGELGIEAVEPLWGEDTRSVLLEFIDAGFEAVIVSANAQLIGEEWIGHRIDREFHEYLAERGIDFCGENGEYHTCVLGGPMFREAIRIEESKTILREGYWLLDTVRYSLQGNGPQEGSNCLPMPSCG